MTALGRAERFDVLVGGGGLAGVAAAVTAARLGAKTLLVERDAALGGNATAAFVHTFCGLYEPIAPGDRAPTPRFAHPGLPSHLTERLVAAGGAGVPERAGRVFVLPTRPPVLEALLARAVLKTPGLAVALGAEIAGATLARDTRGASTVTLLRNDMRTEVTAEVAIDATGDATLASAGGAALLVEPPERLQHASYVFRARGLAEAASVGFARLRITAGLADAARRRGLPPGCGSVLVRPGAPGEAYLTVTLPKPDSARFGPFDPLDPAQLDALTAAGRAAAEAIVGWLRERPESAGCALDALPRRVGVRETRRVRGRAVIEADDVRAGAHRDDEVARSTWAIELWDTPARARFEPVDAACSVPLGALVSATHPRLCAAGRCLSAGHEALGALRVLGTAMATGEAAGAAAALAAQAGGAPGDVSPERVRAAILRLAAEDTAW